MRTKLDRWVGWLRDPRSQGSTDHFEQWPEPEWQAILRRAARHGLTPLLQAPLASEPVSRHIPAAVKGAVREAFLMSQLENTLLYETLGRVLLSFEQAKLPVIALKGAHLAALVYEQIGLRPMGDLDLLVRRADLGRAVGELRKLGYAGGDCSDLNEWCRRRAHLPPLRNPPGPRLELHWTLMDPTCGFRIGVGGLWDRASGARLGGQPTRVLAAEDLLLHLCVHTAGHEPDPFYLGLRPIYDLHATVVRHGPELDWAGFATRAREWRADQCAYLGLGLARSLLETPIPEAVLEALRPRGFETRWADLAREQVLARGEAATQLARAALPLGTWERRRAGTRGSLVGKLREIAFPGRDYMARYARLKGAEFAGRGRGTLYLRRLLELLTRGGRLACYWATHWRQTAAQARLLRHRLQLRKWLEAAEGRLANRR